MSHGWNWRTTINKPGSFRKSKVPCQAKRPWCCHHVHHRTPSAQRKRLDTKVAVMGTSRTPREHGPSKKPGWRPYQRSLFLSARDFHKTRLDIVCVSLFATVVHLPSAFIMLGTCFHACHFRPICTGSAQSDIKYIYIYISRKPGTQSGRVLRTVPAVWRTFTEFALRWSRELFVSCTLCFSTKSRSSKKELLNNWSDRNNLRKQQRLCSPSNPMASWSRLRTAWPEHGGYLMIDNTGQMDKTTGKND